VSFSIKPGAEVHNLHRDMLAAWPVIARVFNLFGFDATVTEVTDTIDRPYVSGHKADPVTATDWRTWANDKGDQMAMSLKDRIAREIERDCPNVKAAAKETHIHTELR